MIAECMPSATRWVGVISMSVKPAAARPSRYFADGQGAGEAADVVAAFGAVGRGEVVGGDDVGDAEAPARFEDPVGLGEHGGLVGGQVDDAVGNDHIDGARRQWDSRRSASV
jgi:hypothetical protein